MLSSAPFGLGASLGRTNTCDYLMMKENKGQTLNKHLLTWMGSRPYPAPYSHYRQICSPLLSPCWPIPLQKSSDCLPCSWLCIATVDMMGGQIGRGLPGSWNLVCRSKHAVTSMQQMHSSLLLLAGLQHWERVVKLQKVEQRKSFLEDSQEW